MRKLSDESIRSLATILGDTNNGFSKSELGEILTVAGISKIDDGSRRDNYSYKIGMNKRDWLYACFLADLKKRNDDSGILKFIKIALSPIRFTQDTRRDLYQNLLDETNKILLLIGIKIDANGKLVETKQANSLDQVDERVNQLGSKMRNRAFHPEITRFCRKDILQKDYYNIVFESAKGLAERVREITGSNLDGGELFQTAFSTKNPLLFFNSLQTESEISEFKWLKEMLEAIFHIARNPAAHTPKINWHVDEEKALDILTMISFAYKYLDTCYPMPSNGNQ